MVDSISECGKIIKCMEPEFSHGQMEENIKVNIFSIKNKGKDFSHGLMEDHTMVNGKTVNNREKVYIKIKMVI